MKEALKKNLTDLFNKHRIVFWYDEGEEYAEDLQTLDMPDVELIKLSPDSQIKIKYMMLKEKPSQKFLVYAPYAEPDYSDNWLLGLQIGYGQFVTEPSSIILSDLGLNNDCLHIIKAYGKFFKSSARTEKLKQILNGDEDTGKLENAMMAAGCLLPSYNLEEIVNKLVREEFDADRKKALEVISTCELWPIVWNRVSEQYGYEADKPSIRDFVVYVFEQSYKQTILQSRNAHPEALFLIKNWKTKFKGKLFSDLSFFSMGQLGNENTIRDKETEILKAFDDYQIVEEEIIHRIAARVNDQAISSREISMVIADRKDTCWYDEFKVLYDALLYARDIQESIAAFTFSIKDPIQAIKTYSTTWCRIDFSYRKFSLCMHSDIKAKNLLSNIEKSIDNLYLNDFLRPLNEAWSPLAAKMLDKGWQRFPEIKEQKNFFNDFAVPVLKDKRTVIVIISDAMRYEVGYQLVSAINGANRYTAELYPMLSEIPSFTQVGMASLLPHQSIEIASDGSVSVDGMPTAGKDSRAAVLEAYEGKNGDTRAFETSEILNMTTLELRDNVRDCKIIYVYQDLIDYNGERDLVGACERAVSELQEVIMRFGSSNATLMYITADHGFLFQNQDLESTEFIAEGSMTGDQITSKNRRFVIGYGLNGIHGAEIRSMESLGYSNKYNLQVAFPNSILRFRLSGADMHFVHGGLSLQEVVVPVIKVIKGRNEDIKLVGLQMLTDVKSITTGSVTVKFYQTEPVTDKCKPFDAKFGIYADDGSLLSNEEIKSIGSTTMTDRDREFSVVFILNRAADDFNGKYVNLVVEQKKEETGRYVDLIKQKVRLSKGFGLDF